MNLRRCLPSLLLPTMITVAWPATGEPAEEGCRAPLAQAAGITSGSTASSPHSKDRRGTWTFVVENDVFAGTDRHYTNGLHVSWLSAPCCVPPSAEDAANWVPFLLDGNGKRRIGYTFGQSMFTPTDIGVREAQPDDRPWAGYLYGGVTLLSQTERTLDTLEIDVGVVGPASFAEQTQKKWHELIGVSQPKGWNNQIKNEPTVALIYERKWREEIWHLGDFGLEVTPYVGGALGNVFTYASTGLGFRIGEDLPADFGPPRIRPSLPGSGFFDLDDRFGWYLFASAEARAIARNIFLDGNTFEDSASVEKLPFVADLQMGVAFMVNQARISIAQVYRTREFRTQDAPDRFGVISLSLKF